MGMINNEELQLFDAIRPIGDKTGFALPTFDFLNRSDREEVVSIRRILQSWFSRYPSPGQEEFRSRFRSTTNFEHDSAFFELLVHELLIRHRYGVELHPEIYGSTKLPDFRVRPEATNSYFYLEATVATYQSKTEAAAEARQNAVYDILNRLVDSPNFFIGVTIREAPTSPPPAKKIARLINAEVKKYDPDLLIERKNRPQIKFNSETWNVIFELIPKSPKARGNKKSRPLAMFTTGFRMVDHRTPLRDAIAGKAKYYGKFDVPFVIAINAVETVDEIDVMEALFGKEKFTIPIVGGAPQQEGIEMERELDGVWTHKNGPRNARLSAVIVGRRLRPWSLDEADFRVYYNPWAQSPIDSILDRLPSARHNIDRMKHTQGEKLSSILGLD